MNINRTFSYIHHYSKRSEITEATLQQIVEEAGGKVKPNLPALILEQNEKNDLLFFDIDTSKGVSTIVSKADQLFDLAPYISFIQVSPSGNLHLVAQLNEPLVESEWKKEYFVYLFATLHFLESLTGIDYSREKSSKGEPAVDEHNAKFSQLFFVSGNQPIVNTKDTFGVTFSASDVKKLNEKYSHLLKKSYNPIPTTTSIEIAAASGDGRRVLIDKNFTVGGYSGTDLRWRIVQVGFAVFREAEVVKAWCDRFFYKKDGDHSIFQKRVKEGYNSLVYKWLVEAGYLVELKEGLYLKEGEYLSDIQSDIVSEIEKHNINCEIVAPTGTGKTRLINDPKGLAFLYNAVVLVPYNVTNALYSNLGVVSSDKTNDENSKLVASGRPIVMVFDQFVNKYSGLLRGRVVIVDEAHLVFSSRNFRSSCSELMTVLKGWEKKVLFTATATGEAECLGIDVVRVGKKTKPVVTTVFDLEGNSFYQISKIIDNELITNEFDTVCIFDDRNSKTVEDYLKIKGCDTLVFRKDTKEKAECKQLLKDETIQKKWFVGTNLSFQGLNFNNTGKVLVITVFREGESYIADVYQEVGRFRKAKSVYLNCIVTRPDIKTVDETLEEQKKINEAYNEFGISEYNYSIQMSEQQYRDLKEIEEYINYNSTVKNLIENMKKSNWMVNEHGAEGSKGRVKIVEKENAEKLFLAAIKKGLDDIEVTNRYIDRLVSLKNTICRRFTEDQIVKLYEQKDSQASLTTYLEYLSELTGYVLNNSLDQLIGLRDVCSKALNHYRKADKEIYRVFRDQFKKVNKAVEIYNLDCDDCYAQMFDGLKVEKEIVVKKKSEGGKIGGKMGGKIGGKNGSPKKRVKDVQTGEIYNSAEKAAKALGVSNSVITYRLKKKLFKQVK